MELENKNVLVMGTGISGIAATNLLKKVKANVILFDSNADLAKEEVEKRLGNTEGVTIITGDLSDEVIGTLDLMVISPGVPTDLPIVNKIRKTGVVIWGEIELAYQFEKGHVAAITGTNGKTTTTALTGAIMKAYFEKVFVVGNIGIPYTSSVSKTTDDSVTVAEMSSFQLETIQDFRPSVSAILNITPDHLNRHHTMEKYIQAKVNITKNQTPYDTCVLNYEDEILREVGKKLNVHVIYFSSERELEEGIFLRGEEIFSRFDGIETLICNVHDLKLIGKHSYENVMAGVAIAISLDVPMDVIKKAICAFEAVEHRIEYVTTKRGVKYYNDSKGTNPDAAIKAIQSMSTKTVLIGGGYDKNSDYKEWIEAFDGKVKKLVLIGQTKEKIAETARECGFTDYVFADTFEEAMAICIDEAKPGEAVLLSPACASWGMFKNFEQRGEIFKELVYKIEE
ncbi:UDP-N-acetylmuramoyl-L-alanine--D-glutamate ligase [Anaerosporobacter faecicola]|uniref:UDP-N-acetylmuramoyl-L-alanine--D-glutamate ligase n=1 Tax=Anaerosporobacter faecicola TaxID=2718714 RepID=UPI0014396312|nr:UDP-N-acetylmuramoyl-L-alanine--D-glutamate ligase [Anaerosporobacter faecicola]